MTARATALVTKSLGAVPRFSGGRQGPLHDQEAAGSHLPGRDFLGEPSLLDAGPRTATIVMEGPGELLVLDRGEFYHLLDVTPSIVRKLLVEMASRQRTTTNALLTA
jgi:CRP-like cAMP-binding protein